MDGLTKREIKVKYVGDAFPYLTKGEVYTAKARCYSIRYRKFKMYMIVLEDGREITIDKWLGGQFYII